MKKTLLIILLLPFALYSQNPTVYDKKQDVKITSLENWRTTIDSWKSSITSWQTTVNNKLKADSITIAFLKSEISTLKTQHFNQQDQINSLLSLSANQADDINVLQTSAISQSQQIKILQDSLRLIPWMIVDTTINAAGKPSLQFRNNTLKVFEK